MSESFSAAINTVGGTPAASVMRSCVDAQPSKSEMSPYWYSACEVCGCCCAWLGVTGPRPMPALGGILVGSIRPLASVWCGGGQGCICLSGFLVSCPLFVSGCRACGFTCSLASVCILGSVSSSCGVGCMSTSWLWHFCGLPSCAGGTGSCCLALLISRSSVVRVFSG